MALYDDRLEITSPGGLLLGVTMDLMKEGFSKIRNRALANAFAYMNLVEAWGSGIPKLMQAMQEYGLREPEFIDMEVAFRINLYRGQKEVIEVRNSNHVNNPVPVSLLSGDRKPQIRFLGNHHSGSGNLYHKSFRM